MDENQQSAQTEQQILIFLGPPKFMGSLSYCDRCGKYVAEGCTPETESDCAK